MKYTNISSRSFLSAVVKHTNIILELGVPQFVLTPSVGRSKKKHDSTSLAAPDQDQVKRSREVKVAPILDPAKRLGNASNTLPFMLDGPFIQSIGEMNNLVSIGDYVIISQLSPFGRCDVVKKIPTCVMRTTPLLNQVATNPEEFLAPFVYSGRLNHLGIVITLLRVKKVGIKKESLEM